MALVPFTPWLATTNTLQLKLGGMQTQHVQRGPWSARIGGLAGQQQPRRPALMTHPTRQRGGPAPATHLGGLSQPTKGDRGNSNGSTAPSGWHPLSQPLLWQGTEEEAVWQKATPYRLAPPWKIMLLSDGSVTRHLQLMTDQRVQVKCLEMRNIGAGREGLPRETELIPGPLVQRQVFLHIPDPHSKAYVYATSWWNAEEVDSYLRDKSQPIWVSLSQGRAELYREILSVEYGNSPYLEQRFQSAGPFWGRSYLFWHNGRPLTLIYEVFSTALQELLGPMRMEEAGEPEGSGATNGRR